MLTGKKFIAIVDVATKHDIETGDEYKEVVNGKKIVANVELIGVNTAQLGQLQGFNLTYSVEVPRILYNDEKYIYFDKKLYSIKNFSKAKNHTNMLLNIQEVNDKAILEVIQKWIQ